MLIQGPVFSLLKATSTIAELLTSQKTDTSVTKPKSRKLLPWESLSRTVCFLPPPSDLFFVASSTSSMFLLTETETLALYSLSKYRHLRRAYPPK